MLDVDGYRFLVIASDFVGVVVARNLAPDVRFFGTNEGIVSRAGDEVQSVAVIEDVNSFDPPEDVDTAVVATTDDSSNLLATRRLQITTDAEIIVRLNDPAYREVYDDLDVETVCATEPVGQSLATRVGGEHDG